MQGSPSKRYARCVDGLPSGFLLVVVFYFLRGNGDKSRLSAGRTVLMISHRLASVKDADRILVLKQGRLVEEGTHAQLLERGDEYHELWTLQARRYASG